MKSSNRIAEYVNNNLKKLTQAAIEEKIRIENENNRFPDPKSVELSEDEKMQINAALKNRLYENLSKEEPTRINAENVIKRYKKSAPLIKLTDKDEHEARKAKRERALYAYVDGLVNAQGYIKNHGDFTRPRQEDTISRMFTDAQMQAYVDYNKEIKKAEHDNTLLPEQKKQRVEELTKEKDAIVFAGIKAAIDKYNEIVGENGIPGDEQLIDNYAKLCVPLKVIQEAHGIISEMKKHEYSYEFLEELERYDRMTTSIMAAAQMYDKRMNVMADPYYPYINLESLFDEDSVKLHYLDEALTMDEPPVIDFEDNIAGILSDVASSNDLELEERIAKCLGMNYEEARGSILFCDKEGNTYSPKNITPYQLLHDTEGEFYVISLYGDKPIIPVLIDPSSNSFKPYVGSAELEKCPALQLPPEPQVGVLHKIAYTIGYTTDTMAEYLDKMEKYEAIKRFGQTRAHIQSGDFPNGVNAKYTETVNKNRALSGDVNVREREIENGLLALHNTPDELENTFMNTLAYMLMSKAYTEPLGSELRSIITDINQPFRDQYTESNGLFKIRENKAFREFCWKLCKDKPELVAKLKSGDLFNMNEAKAAFNEVTGLFVDRFRNKTMRNKPFSSEYVHRNDGKIKEAVSSLELERDNADRWKSILSLYGSERKPRLDWMGLSSGKEVYNMDDWRKMQPLNVDLNSLQTEDMKIDEKTFASLNMMLSLRESDFFTAENLKSNSSAPDTMPFQDIVVTNIPRDNTRQIIEPIIEPTRAKLLNYLRDINGTNEAGISNKTLLAKDLTNAIQIYLKKLRSFEFNKRMHCTLTDVCDKAMNFAKQYNLIDAMKAEGLKDRDIEKCNIASAMGKIINDGFNAEADLALDTEANKHLTKEEKRSCIDKIILMKAIEADFLGCREEPDYTPVFNLRRNEGEKSSEFELRQQNLSQEILKNFSNKPLQFTVLEKNLLEDKLYINDLSSHMFTEDFREKFSEMNGKDILDHLKSNESKIVSDMVSKIKRNYNTINTHYNNVRQYNETQNHIEELGLINAAEFSKKVFRKNDHNSKKLITGLNDDELRKLDNFLNDKDPKEFENFTVLLNGFAQGNKKPAQPEAPKKEPVKQNNNEVQAVNQGPGGR